MSHPTMVLTSTRFVPCVPLGTMYVYLYLTQQASLFEIDWKETFFGSHYSTLKGIKDRYDPYRLFVVAEGVGSEDWNKNLTCRY